MRKIKCINPICGKTFNYNEQKNPNAKKIRCAHCKFVQPIDKPVVAPPLPQPPPPPPPPKSSIKEIGWLVIHDEHTKTATFQLRKGVNLIGRKSSSTPSDVNIAIKTEDLFMSREHCSIEVREGNDGNYEYLLSDRNSANGSYLNEENRLSSSRIYSLRDGDTVQAGRTKLVLKLPSTVNDSHEAEDWVKRTDYSRTIIN